MFILSCIAAIVGGALGLLMFTAFLAFLFGGDTLNNLLDI